MASTTIALVVAAPAQADHQGGDCHYGDDYAYCCNWDEGWCDWYDCSSGTCYWQERTHHRGGHDGDGTDANGGAAEPIIALGGLP